MKMHAFSMFFRAFLDLWSKNFPYEIWKSTSENHTFTCGFGVPLLHRKFLSDIVSVACGSYHTMALTRARFLYAWGSNDSGQLGKYLMYNHIPCAIYLKEPIKSVSCGDYHTVVVTLSDKVFVWGSNEYGQLGLGDILNRFIPTELEFFRFK